MNGMFTRIVISMTLLIGWPCILSAKPWPEPPYSVERIEEFADPDDLEVLYDLSFNQDRTNGKKSIHYGTAFLEDNEPKVIEIGMVTLPLPGANIMNVDQGDRESAQSQHRSLTSIPHPTWDREGRLVNVKAYSPMLEDLALFNKLDFLSALYFEALGSEHTLDLGLLSTDLPLKVVYAYQARFSNVQSLCEIDSLIVISFSASRVEGSIDTSLCPDKFQVLTLAKVQVEKLKLSQSPQLLLINLSKSQIMDSLVLEGSSLTNLKSLDLSETEIPSDVSAIQLPEALVQLYLRKATDSDLSRLELPENIQYVDLRDAQLGDYTFLENAKNLTALNLWGSDFDQWSMLSQFSKLEHLNLNLTSLATDDLAHLSELDHLKTLSLGGTRVTNLEALADLQGLWKLNLYRSELRDLETVPSFQNLSSLILPLEEYHRNTAELPDHIQRMLQEAVSMGECREGRNCPEPPWAE